MVIDNDKLLKDKQAFIDALVFTKNSLISELERTREERDELKQANLMLLSGYMKMIDMIDLESINNEIHDTIKSTKKLLMKGRQ